MRIRIDIDRNHINQRVEEFKEKLYPMIKTQVKKGSDPFTPYLSGDLMDSADASAADSTPYLIYDIGYAKYQFYANGGAPTTDFPNRNKTVHTMACMMWTDAYLSGNGKSDIQALCANAPQLLRF